MKDKKFVLNTVLAVFWGAVLLAGVLVRTFAPAVILPKAGIPNLVLLSLAALLTDYYLSGENKRCYVCVGIFSAVTFGLLPFAGCFLSVVDALKLGIVGGIVFTVTTWLFDSMVDRLSSGPAAKAAPILSALGLYLAAQYFMGIGL